MGLDNEVPKLYLEHLKEHMKRLYDNYDPTQLHNKELGTFRPDCIISDITSEIRKYFARPDHTFRPNSTSVYQITRADFERSLRAMVYGLLCTPEYSEVARWIFLIDTPQEVVVIKAATHQRRQSDSPPYSDEELVRLGIIKHRGSTQIHPDFATKEIWADNFERLWATRPLKPIVGRFFADCLASALTKMTALPAHVIAKVDFIIEGAWPNKGMISSWIGSQRQPETCFIPLTQQMTGEVDVRALLYLLPTFGKQFLLRSDDGDFFAILMLYYLRRVLQGSNIENEAVVWQDRTVNPMILKNPNSPHRFINAMVLFSAIGQMFYTTNPNGTINDLANYVVSTAALFLVNGCDFVDRFVDSYHQHDDGTGNNSGIIIQTKTADGSMQAKQTKKVTRAPPYFSPNRLLNQLYLGGVWRTCFNVTYNKQADIVDVVINYKNFRKCLEDELTIDTRKHPCHDPKYTKRNIKRLRSTLDYWLNGNEKTAQACYQIDSDPNEEGDRGNSTLRYRFEGVRIDPATNKSLYGWRLVPCDPAEIVENSTHQFYIDPEDAATRKLAIRGDLDNMAQYTVFKVV